MLAPKGSVRVVNQEPQVNTIAGASSFDALRSALGSVFCKWLFGETEEMPTPQQKNVIDWIASNALQDSDHPKLTLAAFCAYDPDLRMSVVDSLRLKALTPRDAPSDPTGDAVADALSSLALEYYPELVLRSGTGFSPSPGSPSNERRALEAIKGDSDLPFSEGSKETDWVRFSRSTGASGGVQLSSAASSILTASWGLAKFNCTQPTLHDLISAIPETLEQARKSFKRGKCTALGIASLSGVAMPRGVRLNLKRGFARAADLDDHPYMIRLLHGGAQVAALPDGTDVRVHDVGDIVLGGHFPVRVLVGGSRDLESAESLTSYEYLQEKITQFRLAFLLSWKDSSPPALVPAWSYFVEAFDPVGKWSWNDLPLYVNKTPTLLSGEQVDAWQYWMEKVERINFDKLGQAPVRVLRASAERRDPCDSLVDAVIAWESLFGTESEITFRVSASIARFLSPPGKGRTDSRRRVAEIYHLRSRIVHGVRVAPPDADKAGREAISIAIDCIRKIIAERPDMVKMTSVERSTNILLE
jgi:Apea-like HEPN